MQFKNDKSAYKLLVHIIVHFWELFVNCFAKSAQAADGEFVDANG